MRHHTIETMIKVGPASKALLSALPAEFSKRQFKELRKAMGGDALCFETARESGYIVFVRSEPCTYKKEMDCYEDPVTGRVFRGWYELCHAWSEELAEHFGVKRWSQLDGEMKVVEFEGVRNYYAVNSDKLTVFAQVA